MLLAIICYCGFDGVFGKDGTVDFDWWESKLFSNLAIAYGSCFLKCATFDPFCNKATAGNG
jgi:hypothetical protein